MLDPRCGTVARKRGTVVAPRSHISHCPSRHMASAVKLRCTSYAASCNRPVGMASCDTLEAGSSRISLIGLSFQLVDVPPARAPPRCSHTTAVASVRKSLGRPSFGAIDLGPGARTVAITVSNLSATFSRKPTSSTTRTLFAKAAFAPYFVPTMRFMITGRQGPPPVWVDARDGGRRHDLFAEVHGPGASAARKWGMVVDGSAVSIASNDRDDLISVAVGVTTRCGSTDIPTAP